MSTETPHYKAPGWFTRNVFNRGVAFATRHGVSVWGSRVLAVKGRKSGEWRTTPVNLLTIGDERYLVAPRGETEWVKNIRVAGGGELRVGKKVEPFTVQELYDTLVPYRHYRRDLGIETNQDYEAAVTRLLSGEKGYVRADKAMQDRLKQEMTSAHADVGAFRDYAETRISLAPDALQKLGVSVPAQNPGGYAVGNGNGGAPAQAGSSFVVPGTEAEVACRFCGGTLPEGRSVTYCPHCGQNLSAKHCAGCGSELDPLWKFCINCGKKT